MADGSLQESVEARLCDLRPGVRLVARCRCGREAEVNPSPWLAEGLAATCLSDLETRLRCLCGARRVPLERRSSAPAPTAFGIWMFR